MANNFCTKCGAEIVGEGKFCASCGAQVVSSEDAAENGEALESVPVKSGMLLMGKYDLRKIIGLGAAAMALVLIVVLIIVFTGPEKLELPYGIKPNMSFNEASAQVVGNGFYKDNSWDDGYCCAQYFKGNKAYGYTPDETVLTYFHKEHRIQFYHMYSYGGSVFFDAIKEQLVDEYGKPSTVWNETSVEWEGENILLSLYAAGDGGIVVFFNYSVK